MAEKAKVRAKGNKRTGKLLSSFIVLTILLSVSLVSVATVGAVEQPPEPEVTGITVTADPTSIPMEVGTSTITATVTWANKPTGEGFSIHFELLSPNLGAAIGPAYVSTDASGVATATLAAGLTGGTVTVKASWVGDPGIYDTTTVTIGTPITGLDTLDEYIAALDDSAFDNNPDQRKKVLSDKIEKVRLMIESGEYEKAIKNLEAIRAKADGELGGNPNNDWITDETAQKDICAIIDKLIAYLGAL